MFFPIYLNLSGKRVIVIGGGEVAERKVASLSGTGAEISVISPHLTPNLSSLAKSNTISWKGRNYVHGDCSGATLVFSATDDPTVSRAVWEEATTAGILINTADQPLLCDFIMPAVVRRGDLAIAISTGGASPALAATLREKLSEVFGPEYEELLKLLAQARTEIQRRFHDEGDRKALHYRILESNLIDLLKRQDRESAERLLREMIEEFACEEKTR
jgi:siroheme synthase-like protein